MALAKNKTGNKGKKSNDTVITEYTAVIDNFLKCNLINSQVCYECLKVKK